MKKPVSNYIEKIYEEKTKEPTNKFKDISDVSLKTNFFDVFEN